MSQQRDLFEAELRKPQPKWEVAIDNLNALAMFEMLPALAPLTTALRTQIVGKARSILETQRGWAGAADRIDFAVDVVNDRKITSWSSTVSRNGARGSTWPPAGPGLRPRASWRDWPP